MELGFMALSILDEGMLGRLGGVREEQLRMGQADGMEMIWVTLVVSLLWFSSSGRFLCFDSTS